MKGVAVTALGVLLVGTPVSAQRPTMAGSGGATHVQASLQAVTNATGRPTLWLRLRVDDGWHISYRNPGETGLPTRLVWTLPGGVTVQRESWPVPTITRTDVGVTHTLQGDVPWLIEFDAPRTADGHLVSLTVRYGVCREVCIPGQLTVQGALPGATATPDPLPASVRAQLVRDGGVLRGRRRGAAAVCVADVPLRDGASLPAVLSDTTVMLPVSIAAPASSRPSIHGLFMNSSDSTVLRHGRALLFVRGGSAVAARLELSAGAGGCTTR